MLDQSIRMDVLRLLDRLRQERGLAMVFITHDLAAARWLCDRILVLYAGQLMEEATRRRRWRPGSAAPLRQAPHRGRAPSRRHLVVRRAPRPRGPAAHDRSARRAARSPSAATTLHGDL